MQPGIPSPVTHYSTLMFASRITRAHLSASALKNVANSDGVVVAGSTPSERLEQLARQVI